MMNRRLFLKQAVVGSISLTALGSVATRRAQATTTKPSIPRRFLINIIKVGGTDIFWLHGALRPRDLQTAANPAIVLDSSGGRPYQPVGTGFYDRYTIREDEALLHAHTSSTNLRVHQFGTGFKQLFCENRFDGGAGAPLISKMCIWKGMKSDCLHEVDNPILNHGVASSYALSFTAVVSRFLATESPRILHYTVLESTPQDAHLNFAMNSDFASPSCIPGIAGLAQLTGLDPNDFPLKSRRDLIGDAVTRLAGAAMTNRLTLKSSIASLATFTNSYHAGSALAGSFLDRDIELYYLRSRFLIRVHQALYTYFGLTSNGGSGQLFDALTALPGNAGSGLASGADSIATFRNAISYINAHPIPETTLIAYRAKKILKQDTSTEESVLLPVFSGLIQNLRWLYPDLIEKFALSAFLVRQNLSAVIDFKEGYGMNVTDDPHGNTLPGLIKSMVFHASYAELMQALDEVKNAAGVLDGETLLDATHIVMHTEMDRTPWIHNNSLGINGGSNHAGNSTSVLMAGYGIHGGSVIGDLHKGPADDNQYGALGFVSSMPIDIGTGLPNRNGTKVSIKSLAPTVIEMFGEKLVPLQQISDESFVPAVVKRRMA
ncbi:MAG: DUF1501 domain-containing protein [Methylotenera sp.]|nr:DUF1501 domain-containing protein [Oligoflexia bacterium]